MALSLSHLRPLNMNSDPLSSEARSIFSQEKPFEPADRICIGVILHEVFMFIKSSVGGLAFFASVSWPVGDKFHLVTFNVRASSPSGTRISTPWSERPDTSTDQITRS